MTIVHELFTDVVETTTSPVIDIKGARKVTLIGKRADNAGGTSAFAAEVGIGTSFVTYNKWIDNVTNTNAQALTRVAGKSIANANGVIFLTMSPEDAFEFIKVTVTETSDGTHSAWLVVDYGHEIK